MFLLLMQFLILHIDKLIGKDIPLSVIIELIFTNLAYMVVLAAPMAVLVATLMAFGKFSELNELTAIRASGIHPLKVITPVMLASLVVCAVLVWFSNDVLPEANHKSRSLFIDIRLQKPGFDLKPNEFYDGIDGYTFLVDEVDNETDSLYGITLFQEPSRTVDRAVIKAKKGLLKAESNELLTLYLVDGNMQKFPSSGGLSRVTIEKNQFDKHRITFDLADLAFEKSDPNRRNRSDRTMNIQSMLVIVDSLKQEIVQQYEKAANNTYTIPNIKYDYEYDEKYILPDTTKQEELLTTGLIVADQLKNKEAQKELFNKTTSDLNNYKATLENSASNILFRTKSINRYLVEIHKKFSIPFACVVFILLGAPIGIMTRKGNFGIAAIISAVILTFYWLSLIQGEKLADRLFVTPFWGMWTFDIVFSSIGILLLIKLSTEVSFSRLFRRS